MSQDSRSKTPSRSSKPRSRSLIDAWHRFAVYDQNSVELQTSFHRLHGWIAASAVAATALAVVYAQLKGWPWFQKRPWFEPTRHFFWLLVVGAPILGSILTAGATRIDRSTRWVLLRAQAENLKREIYRYRAMVGPYDPLRTEKTSRDHKLSQKVEAVSRAMLESDVAKASLRPYKEDDDHPLPPKYGVAEGDDGFSDLTADRYVEVRAQDQLAYFQRKSMQLDRRYRRLQWTIAALGGVGALFAVLGQELWIPVSVSLAVAMTNYLELRRVEPTVASYSQAAIQLENAIIRWRGLTDNERGTGRRREQIVHRIESILQSESSDWQEEMEEAMKEAMEELREVEQKTQELKVTGLQLKSPPKD